MSVIKSVLPADRLQAEYVDLVPMFSILNEALLDQIGKSEVTSLYAFRVWFGSSH